MRLAAVIGAAMLAASSAWQAPLRTTPRGGERVQDIPAGVLGMASPRGTRIAGPCRVARHGVPTRPQPVMAAPPEVQAAFLLVMLLSVSHGLLPSPAPITKSRTARKNKREF